MSEEIVNPCPHALRHTERRTIEDFPLDGAWQDMIEVWCADCGEYLYATRSEKSKLDERSDKAIENGEIPQLAGTKEQLEKL
jgi:hypothetical protein